MKLVLTVLLVLGVLSFLALGVIGSKLKKRPGARGAVRGRAPLSKREQAMYFRLTQALPEHVVLAQVAFSALMTATDRRTRNYFDRKVADFLVCDKAFTVLAIVELDDKSHEGKQSADATRDAMLAEAGYRVIRYAQVPDQAKVVTDFGPKPT